MRIRGIAPFALLVALGAVVTSGSTAQTLRQIELAPTWHSAPISNGQVVTLDGPAGRVTVWSETGRAAQTFDLPDTLRLPLPSELAARPGFILVGAAASENGPMLFNVVSLGSHKIVGKFVGPEWPARVFASAKGWLFETVSSDGPTLVEVDDHGRRVRTIAPPPGIADRAESAVGRRDASTLRVAASASGLWAVPAGMYEVWRLPSHEQRFDVPACLWIAGNAVEGDAARQKALQTLDRVDETIRRTIEARIYSSMGSGRPFHAFFAAMVAIAACGNRLAVLVDAMPKLTSGGCRLDVWRVPDGTLLSSVPVPGPRPGRLALARHGAWVLQGRHFSWIPLPDASTSRPSVCPQAKPGELRLSTHGTGHQTKGKQSLSAGANDG